MKKLLFLVLASVLLVSCSSSESEKKYSIRIEQTPAGSTFSKAEQDYIRFKCVVKNTGGRQLDAAELTSFDGVDWKSTWNNIFNNAVYTVANDEAVIDCSKVTGTKTITISAEMFFKKVSAKKTVTITQ